MNSKHMEAVRAVHEWKEQCDKLFSVDPSSPSGLRWRNPRGKRKAGDVAGSRTVKSGNVYWNVFVHGKRYLSHHIVAALANIKGWEEVRVGLTLNPKHPELMIDHIKGSKAGNAPSNLRVVTPRTNSCNLEVHRDSKVVPNITRYRNKHRLTLGVGGKNRHLGIFPSVVLAERIRDIVVRGIDNGVDVELLIKRSKEAGKIVKSWEV